MTTEKRAVARLLANRAVAEGRPLSWFEELYAKARVTGVCVPWADMTPNRNVFRLFDLIPPSERTGQALKVGCGYGDDAEWLAERGFSVTAFDISPTAIASCIERFRGSRVTYLVADLFAPPSNWKERFQVVWESYTLQVLPPALRSDAMRLISSFVAPDGYLLFVTRARAEEEEEGAMPWPLTKAEAQGFQNHGLSEVYFEDYRDSEEPPVRRFRACFRKMSSQSPEGTCSPAG